MPTARIPAAAADVAAETAGTIKAATATTACITIKAVVAGGAEGPIRIPVTRILATRISVIRISAIPAAAGGGAARLEAINTMAAGTAVPVRKVSIDGGAAAFPTTTPPITKAMGTAPEAAIRVARGEVADATTSTDVPRGRRHKSRRPII